MGGMLLSLSLLVLNAWLYHAAATGMALSVENRHSASVVIGLVLVLLAFGWRLHGSGLVTLAYLTPYPMLARLLPATFDPESMAGSVKFYGLVLHPAIFTSLVQGSILVFLLWAVARKLQSEGAIAFSRPAAIAFFAWLICLSFGGWWTPITDAERASKDFRVTGVDVVVLYVIVATLVASALLVSLTPSYLEHVRTLRRARRRGRAEAHWLEDGAGTWRMPAIRGCCSGGWRSSSSP